MLRYQVLRIKEYIRYGPSSPSRALIPPPPQGGALGAPPSARVPLLCVNPGPGSAVPGSPPHLPLHTQRGGGWHQSPEKIRVTG